MTVGTARDVLDPVLAVLPDPTSRDGEEPVSRRSRRARRHREAADRLRDAHGLLAWTHDGLLANADPFAPQPRPPSGGLPSEGR